MATYVKYDDPGHGWLKVPKKELTRLGIAGQITHCSYERGEYAYLEEDCDMSLFLCTKKDLEEPIRIVERHTNRQSKIRSYPSYSSGRGDQ